MSSPYDVTTCRVIIRLTTVPRWEGDARERLEQAALELFAEHGFDAVTVPEITARAQLTTRTFHRHFADKREVLFGDADQIPEIGRRLVADAPAELSPAEVVRHALPGLAAAAFDGRREFLRERRAIIDAHPALRERELAKMARLGEQVTQGFVDRGLAPVTAAVVASAAVGVARVSISRWLEAEDDTPLADLLLADLDRATSAFG